MAASVGSRIALERISVFATASTDSNLNLSGLGLTSNEFHLILILFDDLLKDLEVLDVSHNSLMQWPEVERFEKLRWLNLSHNLLHDMPPALKYLHDARGVEYDVSHNPCTIYTLPVDKLIAYGWAEPWRPEVPQRGPGGYPYTPQR